MPAGRNVRDLRRPAVSATRRPGISSSSFVHFFTSEEAAKAWFAERQMPVSFITVDEEFRLSRIRFADMIAQA